MSKRSLSSRLTIRLIWIALFISVLLSAGAYLTVRNAFGGVVGDRAVLNAARFNTQNLDLMDRNPRYNPAALQRALDEYVEATRGVQSSLGRFVAVRLYGEDGTLLASRESADHERMDAINDLLNRSRGLEDAEPGQIQQGIRVEGVPYVRVYLPLVDSDGREVVHADLVFALSEATFAYLRQRTLKMFVAVFMIVMTTTLILSPAVFSLISEEERQRGLA